MQNSLVKLSLDITGMIITNFGLPILRTQRTHGCFYKHNEKEFIYSFAIQKDSPIIAISAGLIASNIFLIDRNRLRAGARNLTENRFNTTKRVGISYNGDILFTNTHANPFPEVIEGLYFMPR